MEAAELGKRTDGSRASAVRVAAVDLGASSGRVIVGSYDMATGLQLEEVYRFENGPVPHAEPMQWDFNRLLSEVQQGIARAQDRYELTSVGIDTWGVDYGLLDFQGRLLANPTHYRNDRTRGYAERSKHAGLLTGAYAETGIQALDINTLFQLMAQRASDGELLDRAQRLLLMPDLLIWGLTGVQGCEVSMASTTQLLGASGKSWSKPLLERFGIKEELLPAIGHQAEVVGRIKAGLPAYGLPVVRVCGHDTASAVAALIPAPNEAFVSCGTWSLAGKVVDEPVLTAEAERLGFSNERGAEGCVLLLKNCTGLWIAQQVRRELEEYACRRFTWEEIAQAAATAQPYRYLVDTEDPRLSRSVGLLDAIIAMAGIDDALEAGRTVSPELLGALFRCVYDSLALGYRGILSDIECVTHEPVHTIRLIGGGARNAVLCQAVADATGKLVVAGPYEATAVGNILVQLVACDLFETLDQARRTTGDVCGGVRYEPRIEPTAEVLDRFLMTVKEDCHA